MEDQRKKEEAEFKKLEAVNLKNAVSIVILFFIHNTNNCRNYFYFYLQNFLLQKIFS